MLASSGACPYWRCQPDSKSAGTACNRFSVAVSPACSTATDIQSCSILLCVCAELFHWDVKKLVSRAMQNTPYGPAGITLLTGSAMDCAAPGTV
jgi:hypothetical protein